MILGGGSRVVVALSGGWTLSRGRSLRALDLAGELESSAGAFKPSNAAARRDERFCAGGPGPSSSRAVDREDVRIRPAGAAIQSRMPHGGGTAHSSVRRSLRRGRIALATRETIGRKFCSVGARGGSRGTTDARGRGASSAAPTAARAMIGSTRLRNVGISRRVNEDLDSEEPVARRNVPSSSSVQPSIVMFSRRCRPGAGEWQWMEAAGPNCGASVPARSDTWRLRLSAWRGARGATRLASGARCRGLGGRGVVRQRRGCADPP